MKLYTYFRSSAAWRARIGLAWKQLSYDTVPVHLLNNGGEQHKPDYKAANPQELVPTLADGAVTIGQSLAILEYLEEKYPVPPLLPETPEQRAAVRQMALLVACDIHPLNNLSVMQYLEKELQADEVARDRWYAHWINEGLKALEILVTRYGGIYCYGDTVTMADMCLVPQLYNARRRNLDLAAYPRLLAIDAVCAKLPAFFAAHPDQQPDKL
jgi:maleylacetoacetate isomerase